MTTSYPFIHHVCIYPSDFGASEVFYSAALAPLGLLPGDLAEDAVEYWEQREGEGERDTPSFALTQAPSAKDETRGVHLAFTARDRVEVDAFHRAALATGGTERHAPPPLAGVPRVLRVRLRPRRQQRRGSPQGDLTRCPRAGGQRVPAGDGRRPMSVRPRRRDQRRARAASTAQ